jgi:predicted P-loop ATPase/GTPase
MSNTDTKKVKLILTMHLEVESVNEIKEVVNQLKKIMDESGIKSDVNYTVTKEKTHNGI